MKEFYCGIKKENDLKYRTLQYDVVVVGGGLAGICAAAASARSGAKTLLIHNRPVLGGNASSEIRMMINGGNCHWGKKHGIETGIILELMLENKHRNNRGSYSEWDAILWSFVKNCPNLTTMLNTTMTDCVCENNRIREIVCYQLTTEIHCRIEGKIFCDCTGHGTLGYLAGAEYRIGAEDRYEFGEEYAPETRSGATMGNTLLFCASDRGHPVTFEPPAWIRRFDEDDLYRRPHGDVVVYHTADDVVTLPANAAYDAVDELVEKYDVQYGYWWIELGGDYDDIIGEYEEIRDDLLCALYGIWDHIKNHGDHGAENYELEWVGMLPGMRESRRLVGDYLLSEGDIRGNRRHPDGVAYGGWPMDDHVPGGLNAKGSVPSRVMSYDGFYSIPYRCYYSKNIDNLMMAGRCISATKLGLSSARVMGTCAVGGQAVGTAAAMAATYGITPREVGENRIGELRRRLLRDDCYIPGCFNDDPADMARSAAVTASSWQDGYEPEKVISGIARFEDGDPHLWVSKGLSEDGEWLKLSFASQEVSEIRLSFDPNLSEEKSISMSKAYLDEEVPGTPPELVRDFKLILTDGGRIVWERDVKDNYQRQLILRPDQAQKADCVELHVTATNGDADVRIYEVRIY